jgi:type II secretory pathway component PulK
MRTTIQTRQGGAAVVMALFIVVLCTLAVAPLIWNLFATAKTISVAAARDQGRCSQSKWRGLGARDFA